jgi:pimeloyl-ACP methyl ester carboxylesterase
LLHGFASGTFTWAGVAPLLADRHRLVAWDRAPFGRSERPRIIDPDPYALDAQLEHTQAVLAAEGLTAPVLVGHSAGALHAVQATVSYTVAPTAVVLIAPALDGSPPPLIRALARTPGVGSLGRLALRMALPHTDRLLHAMGRNPTPLIEATAAQTAETLALPGTAEALWHLTSTWTSPGPVAEQLRVMRVPTLVIGGDDDRIVNTESQARTVEALGATWHRLPGVGHAPQEQVPNLVAEIITDFCQT